MATAYGRTNGDGSVTWYTKVYNPKTGRRDKPIALTAAKTRPQAKRLADEIENEEERLSHGLASGARFRGTFHQLCQWAFDVHFVSTRSADSDKSRLKVHAGPASSLGKLDVSKVTSAEINKYLNEYAKTTTVKGGPPSPGAINRLRAWYSAVFRVAAEHAHWPESENPVKASTKRVVPQGSAETLAPHEVPLVLEALDDYWRPLVATALLAGLRKGELYALQKKDVLLEQRLIMVQRSHDAHQTKGSVRPEPVPIHESLVPFLEAALAAPGPLMFPGRNGKQRARSEHADRVVQRAMVRAGLCDWYDHKCRRCRTSERHDDGEQRRCSACGFKLWPVGHARPVTFHGTRHSCATNALTAGASLASVQAIMRHKDPRLTVNTYGHLTKGHLVDEINRVRYAGFATPAQPVAPTPTPAHGVQPTSPVGKPARPRLALVGATLVHGDGAVSVARPGLSRTQPDLPGSDAAEGAPSNTVRCTGGGKRRVGDREQRSEVVDSAHVRSPRAEQPSAPVGGFRGSVGAPLVRGSSAPLVRGRGATPPVGRQLLSVREAAARLRMSESWVYKAINRGLLEYVCVGVNTLRLPLATVEAYQLAQPGLRPTATPPKKKREPMAPATRRKGARS